MSNNFDAVLTSVQFLVQFFNDRARVRKRLAHSIYAWGALALLFALLIERIPLPARRDPVEGPVAR